MEFVQFSNGNKMPIVGLGTWLCNDVEELTEALDSALEAGYRHFDTAYVYKNEAVLGNVFKKWFDSNRITREELFVTTKLPSFRTSPELVGNILQKSLDALQLDYVDLYLIHVPFPLQYNPDTDSILFEDGQAVLDESVSLEDVWTAMEESVGLGKTRSIGISNFDEDQVERIVKVAQIQPSCLQLEMHAYLQEASLRAVCDKHDIRIVAYSPLGSPGRKAFYETVGLDFEPTNMIADPVVTDIASKYGKSPAQILLRFLVQQGITVIPKSTNPQRLQENLEILDFELSAEDFEALQGLDKGDAGRTICLEFVPGIDKHPEFPKHFKRSWELLGK